MSGRGRPPTHNFCQHPGCNRNHYAKGLCQSHYRRERKKEVGAAVSSQTCFTAGCGAGRYPGSNKCLAHTLEQEFYERGSTGRLMLPTFLV